MTQLKRANTISNEHTLPITFPANPNRSYFFVVVTSGSGGVKFGGGTGIIPLEENQHYAPPVCPISQIELTGSGTCVVHMG